MSKRGSPHSVQDGSTRSDRARYEPPNIRVYTEEEILAQLGPAQLYAGPVPFQF